MDTITHYINGVTVDTQSGRHADVFNPALGEPVARVALGTAEEVDAAVRAAEAAFPRGPPRRR
jgi:malonate-semialdehyde dehydrogenase (acetylating)/methylmalonate-semialdehyde dehydrogenase